MKTLNTTTQNMPQIRKRARLTLTLAGIITAIICSLIFLSETRAMGDMIVSVPGLAASPKIISNDYSVALKNIDVASRVLHYGLGRP